jgi:hypothetical protein
MKLKTQVKMNVLAQNQVCNSDGQKSGYILKTKNRLTLYPNKTSPRQ